MKHLVIWKIIYFNSNVHIHILNNFNL